MVDHIKKNANAKKKQRFDKNSQNFVKTKRIYEQNTQNTQNTQNDGW